MRVRFFAGTDYSAELLDSEKMIEEAYSRGVPMGGELVTEGNAPTFLVWANADPRGTALQRLQIVKGWEKDGETFEHIIDVACSDGLTPNPETDRCPDNGARVNLADCSITGGLGATELRTVWEDPNYIPGSRSFYYVRALENPTCRWSTWDAIRAGVDPRPDLHITLQERVWSSPIWVN